MRSELEKLFFKEFRKFYSGFPVGEIQPTDKPDYIINTGDKKIGIEITQLFVDSLDGKQSNKKRLEILQNQLGEKLCRELESLIPFKFVLSIQFSDFDISLNKIDSIITKCVNHIKTIRGLGKFESFSVENEGDLPDELLSIEIRYGSSLSKSFFSYVGSAILPDLSSEHIQSILNTKHKKLTDYQECNEHWLLIVEDIYLSSSFGENNVKSVKSDFDKVFLLRRFKDEKIIELK